MELLARSGLTRLRLLLSEGVEPRRELVEPVQEGLKKRAWKTKKWTVQYVNFDKTGHVYSTQYVCSRQSKFKNLKILTHGCEPEQL